MNEFEQKERKERVKAKFRVVLLFPVLAPLWFVAWSLFWVGRAKRDDRQISYTSKGVLRRGEKREA